MARSKFALYKYMKLDDEVWRYKKSCLLLPLNPNAPPSEAKPSNPLIQPSLIFPVPCEFINADLRHVAVIRPLDDKFGGAVATMASFTADGLFVGQSKEFIKVVNELAEEADAARREF